MTTGTKSAEFIKTLPDFAKEISDHSHSKKHAMNLPYIHSKIMNGRMKSKARLRRYPVKEELVFGLGLIPKEGVPEIKIRYNRSSKKFLGKVTNSKDAADFIRRIFPRGTIQLHERFLVLYLNRANEILGYYHLSIGGVSGTVADPKLIFSTALVSLASSIILSHNHPSGNTSASQADIQLTQKIKQGGKLLDIQVLDHLILTSTAYFSFADQGLI